MAQTEDYTWKARPLQGKTRLKAQKARYQAHAEARLMLRKPRAAQRLEKQMHEQRVSNTGSENVGFIRYM